ncbi:Mss4-like protein [Auriculariales sp. MPI-PUGE-AT-0066]|nr:Mss4-like protein [Auriculariales sp. MPI-PUGE-AT-0066]
MYEGNCYCGSITFTVDDELRDAIICHCSTCQHLHSALSSSIPTMLDKVSVTSAAKPKVYEDTRTGSGIPAKRYFCPECGSSVYAAGGPRGQAFIKTGTVVGAKEKVKVKAQMHSESALAGMLYSEIMQLKF